MIYSKSGSKAGSQFEPSFWGLGKNNTESKKKPKHDRFVPDIVGTDLFGVFKDHNDKENQSVKTQFTNKYTDLLKSTMLKNSDKKVLKFKDDTSKENVYGQSNLDLNHSEDQIKKYRKIPNKPYKQMLAPQLRDDFYLNLIDWGSSDQIGAGLRSEIAVWSGCLSRVQKIYQSEDNENIICSLAFPKFTNHISFGDSLGKVYIYDLAKKTEVQSLEAGAENRVGSIACTSNLMCTGSKSGMVSIYDFRNNKSIFSWKAHNQQICGIKWSHDGQMIASGGNDNRMNLFSLKTMTNMAEFPQHKAAVKALAFDPHSPVIATGGGSADKCLRFFSTQTLKQVYIKDTGSQICNIHFSPVSRELVTTHGFSLNQINVYKINKENKPIKTSTLTGHKFRVLYLAGENYGPRFVTGAGDQCLKFWNVFEKEQEQSRMDHFGLR